MKRIIIKNRLAQEKGKEGLRIKDDRWNAWCQDMNLTEKKTLQNMLRKDNVHRGIQAENSNALANDIENSIKADT